MTEVGRRWGRVRGDAVMRPVGHTSAYHLFKRYRESARNRNLAFEIDLPEFMSLTSKDCAYCGVPPHRSYGVNRANGRWSYNGLDRVDNSIGYVSGNVVPCCRDCNSAKKNWSLAQFYAWIERIHGRRGKVATVAS